MFTKLFSSITDSTIWRESNHVRLVWITMLAKSDSAGFVWASIPGLADAARVSIEECSAAIEKLKSPDEWSRSKENEGKRIEDVDGGWRLLNYEKYKKIKNSEERREYVRRKVSEHRRNVNNVINVNKSKHIRERDRIETETDSFKKEEVAPKVATMAKKVKLSDDEFIQSLRDNLAFKHINLDSELSKMDAWLLTKPGRQKTRKFIVAWLNRIDAPLASSKITQETKKPFDHSWPDFTKK